MPVSDDFLVFLLPTWHFTASCLETVSAPQKIKRHLMSLTNAARWILFPAGSRLPALVPSTTSCLPILWLTVNRHYRQVLQIHTDFHKFCCAPLPREVWWMLYTDCAAVSWKTVFNGAPPHKRARDEQRIHLSPPKDYEKRMVRASAYVHVRASERAHFKGWDKTHRQQQQQQQQA